MRRIGMGNNPFLSYYDMTDGVTAFSTTRDGGVSKGNYAHFNINEYCGDDTEAVTANRKMLADEIETDIDRIIIPHQVHGTEIRCIDEEYFSLTAEEKKKFVEGVDCVMTSMRYVCVGVSTADCIPVLIFDKEHHACCAVHAGWRGTVQRITSKAISAMTSIYGTESSKLHACIGSGISLANFEVGNEVYDKFLEEGFDMEKISRKYEKWHIDLPECNRIQMIEAGVKPDNIISSDICTYSNADKYFSARRLGILSGRIYSGLFATDM